MLTSMAAFAATDMFIKLATQTVPVAEVILITSAEERSFSPFWSARPESGYTLR